MQLIAGIFLVQVFAVWGCLADITDKNSTQDGNKTATTESGTGAESSSEGLFSTEFKVFLGLAAAATVIACCACVIIKKKSENQYATGDNLPATLVPLSAKF